MGFFLCEIRDALVPLCWHEELSKKLKETKIGHKPTEEKCEPLRIDVTKFQVALIKTSILPTLV